MLTVKRLIFFLGIVGTLSLQADLENCLKKETDKCPDHAFENIDYIYMINLDQRPEKWEKSLEQLEPYGIYPYRFSAVNGWELDLKTINEAGLPFSMGMEGGFMGTSYLSEDLNPIHGLIENYGQTYFCHCMARGTIGIALSHISILQDAYDCGYKRIWVMEDDIEVKQDPRILPNLIKKLNALVGENGWDVLFTDRDIKDRKGNEVPTYWAAKRPDFTPLNDFFYRFDISPDFRMVGARYGAHSMIVSREGIRKLLQFFYAHQIFLPYDMDYILPHGIRLFTVREDVVTNLVDAISDNGGANYKKSS